MCRNYVVEVLHASSLELSKFILLMTAILCASTDIGVQKGVTAGCTDTVQYTVTSSLFSFSDVIIGKKS